MIDCEIFHPKSSKIDLVILSINLHILEGLEEPFFKDFSSENWRLSYLYNYLTYIMVSLYLIYSS